ncbi:neuronal acetylcholine receptor subunit alpha-6-like [Ylistrum balloti]|uniref:neuronal acetylcholine receptor subunit alpha-6-like n=1 Tax=Ylistrum balloti TaxID=509963 RepID=UPI002905842A|nr:neuronal acetylcholine receptor subunit alpha-6-like [Ylistrum balloti]
MTVNLYRRRSSGLDLVSQVTSIIMLCILLPYSYAGSYRNMSNLHKDLRSNYNRDIRPLSNQSSSIAINIMYTLTSLNEFDAVNGRMVTTGSLYVTWMDEMITWLPSDYDDIKTIKMRETFVWAPTFVVANGADDIYIKGTKSEDSTVLYDNTGKASLILSGLISTTCDPDITYYPYDVHQCNLQFTTKEPMNEVSLNFDAVFILPGADSNLFWKLEYSEMRAYNVQNTNTFIEVTFALERRPTFSLYNILVPVCLLNFVNLLAFVLPADSGERVSFATTILLTISVYMTIMSNSIPNTSDPVSILTISLMIKLINSSLIVLTVIGTLNIYRLSDVTPIPSWLSRMLCLHKNSIRKIKIRGSRIGQKLEMSDLKTEHCRTNCDIEVKGATTMEQKKMPDSSITWSKVGRSLDYMLLLVFSLVISIETIFHMVRIICRRG